MYRFRRFAGTLAVCLLVFAGMGYASPEIWATGTARPCDAPEFEGFWEYCYEVHWTGLRNAVSHIEVILCPSGDCGCDCDPEFFAFADTVGRGNAQEDQILVHYYGGMESSGDPSTGLEGFLIKFEPFEGLSEPGQDGSATLCFYSVAAPVLGNYPDRIGMKFGGEYALGVLDGALPGCRQGFSPTDTKTWGYVKALYR